MDRIWSPNTVAKYGRQMEPMMDRIRLSSLLHHMKNNQSDAITKISSLSLSSLSIQRHWHCLHCQYNTTSLPSSNVDLRHTEMKVTTKYKQSRFYLGELCNILFVPFPSFHIMFHQLLLLSNKFQHCIRNIRVRQGNSRDYTANFNDAPLSGKR